MYSIKANTRITREQEDEELETELNTLKDKVEEENKDTPEEPPVKTKEDESWSKRYSDLRSYASKKENELKKELEDLKKKLESKPTEGPFPKKVDKETVLQWKRDYPDVYGILADIISEQSGVATEDIKTKLSSIEAERHELAKQRAFQVLLQLHPDFLEIKDTDTFQSWVAAHEEKGRRGNAISQGIYEALWVNETDPELAADAISLYKKEGGKAQKKKTDTFAPTSVTKTNSSGPSDGDGKRRWKASEVKKLSSKEYDLYAEEIDLAYKEGRYIEDDSEWAAR